MKRCILFSIIALQVILSCFKLTAVENYSIQGRIYDIANNIPVDYVNIGIIGKNFGTVSNSSGVFHLQVPRHFLDDSLTFSRIGYYSKSILVRELIMKKNIEVVLTPKITDIQEVQIISKKLKLKRKGNITRTHNMIMTISSDTSRLGSEVGTVINLPKTPVHINDLNFHIVSNKPDSVKLRFNIYDYSKGKIGNNLLAENIYFTIKQEETGDYKFDLRNYNIYASGKIFISIENVAVYISHGPDPRKKYDEYFYDRISISVALLGAKSFWKKASMANWEKTPSSIAPGLWLTYFE